MYKILEEGIAGACSFGSELTKALTSIFLSLLIFSSPSYAQNAIKVGITASMPTVQVNHRGLPVEIKRIQDTNNKLVDDFSKTSRPCPPFCIHPMEAAPGVSTVGELDVLEFINNEVKQGSGLLIDARMPKFYNSETIPGSVNIPFILFTSSANDILPLLGVENTSDTWDFSNANELLLWCNGPWCDQSPRAINALVQAGYPAAKLRYYRGGMQLWKILGLTTIQPVSNEVGNN